MEFTWTLVVFFFFFLFLRLLFKRKSLAGGNLRPPPTPSFPEILIQFFRLRHGSMVLAIGPALRRLRPKYGPILTFKLGPFLSSVFILDRYLAHEALVQKGAFFCDREPPRDGGAVAILGSKAHTIGFANGDLWRVLRRNLATAITGPQQVKSRTEMRRLALRHLLADLRASGDGPVAFARVFRRSLCRLLTFMCFGEEIDAGVVREIEELQHAMVTSLGWKLHLFDITPWITKLVMWRRWRRFLEVRRRQEAAMIPLVDARRRCVGGDPAACYVDSLIDLVIPEGSGERKLTDVEIVSLCNEFLHGGMDGTAAAMEWAMANLVKYPPLQQRLHDEIAGVVAEGREIEEDDLGRMPYLKAVTLETLRRHPPAHNLLPRAVAEDVQLGGFLLPAGSVVNFSTAEMAWDGEAWEEPMEFRPERFLAGGEGEGVDVMGGKEVRMIPFGAGRRVCPGLALGLLHLQYFTAGLVREFEWRAAVDGEEVDLAETADFTVVMKHPLRPRITPRATVSGLN